MKGYDQIKENSFVKPVGMNGSKYIYIYIQSAFFAFLQEAVFFNSFNISNAVQQSSTASQKWTFGELLKNKTFDRLSRSYFVSCLLLIILRHVFKLQQPRNSIK